MTSYRVNTLKRKHVKVLRPDPGPPGSPSHFSARLSTSRLMSTSWASGPLTHTTAWLLY